MVIDEKAESRRRRLEFAAKRYHKVVTIGRCRHHIAADTKIDLEIEECRARQMDLLARQGGSCHASSRGERRA